MLADLIFIISYYGILLWIRHRWKIENVELKKINPIKFITPILYFSQKRRGKRYNEPTEIGLILFEVWCHIMTVVLIINMVMQNLILESLNSIQRVLFLTSGVIITIIYELLAWIYKKIKK